MNKLFLLISFMLIACGKEPERQLRLVRKEASSEERQWILECIKNGNPMSDEEGEDLVKQCEITARKLFAPIELEQQCWLDDGRYFERQVSCDDWTTIIYR